MLLNSIALFPEQSPSGWKQLLLKLKRHARKASFHHSRCNLRQCKSVQAFRCTNKLQKVPSTQWDKSAKAFTLPIANLQAHRHNPYESGSCRFQYTQIHSKADTDWLKKKKKKKVHHFSRWAQNSTHLTEFKCRYYRSINPMHTRCRNMICIWSCSLR